MLNKEQKGDNKKQKQSIIYRPLHYSLQESSVHIHLVSERNYEIGACSIVFVQDYFDHDHCLQSMLICLKKVSVERILEAQTALCSTELKVYHLFYLYKERKDTERVVILIKKRKRGLNHFQSIMFLRIFFIQFRLVYCYENEYKWPNH